MVAKLRLGSREVAAVSVENDNAPGWHTLPRFAVASSRRTRRPAFRSAGVPPALLICSTDRQDACATSLRGRVLPCQDSVGAQHAVPAAALPSLNKRLPTRLSQRVGSAPDTSLSPLPLMRPRKRRQAAALQTERRPDTVECGSLLPLSTPGRVLPYHDSVGAQLAAPAEAPPSLNTQAARRFS